MSTPTPRLAPASSSLERVASAAREAARFVAPRVVRTPLVRLPWLDVPGRRVWAKVECHQRTGSFKIRGALNAVHALEPGTRVITASAGNHGLAVAAACRELGFEARVLVPVGASELKIRRIAAQGARVASSGLDLFQAIRQGRREAEDTGSAFLSPFDHPDVVAGQGSVAWEILEDRPEPFDVALVPLGGGGLLGGVASVLRRERPETTIHAIHPSSFGRAIDHATLHRALAQPVRPTIADGLAVQHGREGEWLADLLGEVTDHFVEVSEERIKIAVLATLYNEGLLTEGAGAVPVAALLDDPEAERFRGDVLVLLSGGNLSTRFLSQVLATRIDDPALRKLVGLRTARLPMEIGGRTGPRPDSDDRPAPAAEEVLGTEALGEEASASPEEIWRATLDRLRRRFDDLAGSLEIHRRYVGDHDLAADDAVIDRLAAQLDAARAFCDLARLDGDGGAEHLAGRFRLLVQEYGFLRTALAWSSASTDQSRAVLFFDPAELTPGAVNYDRYGTAALRDLELHLARVLGFDPAERDVLVTSSGQGAYSTLESFLVREVLGSSARVVTAPYIYFEAFEQLEALPHLEVIVADSWEPRDLVESVEATDARVLFADPVANTGDASVIDFRALARHLEGRDWSDRWLLIDGTLVSGGFDPFAVFDRPHHPRILYYESASKYLQLGMDLQMVGVCVTEEGLGARLANHRRNLGAALSQAGATKFPRFSRREYLARMAVLTRNAETLAAALRGFDSPRARPRVAFPDRWRDLGWRHAGGLVALTFDDPGLDNRPCLDMLIERILERCRHRGLAITQGVSFGFGVARVSAASAVAETTDPFLRFSLGEESPEQIDALCAAVLEALHDHLEELATP